ETLRFLVYCSERDESRGDAMEEPVSNPANPAREQVSSSRCPQDPAGRLSFVTGEQADDRMLIPFSVLAGSWPRHLRRAKTVETVQGEERPPWHPVKTGC